MIRTTLSTVLIVAAFPALSCDGGGTETENQPPEAIGEIPDHILSKRSDSVIDLAVYFRDLDGDDLTYQATASVARVVSVTMAGGALTLMSGDSGISAVTVTASDPDDATAQQSFDVTVRNQPPVAVGEMPHQLLSRSSDLAIDIARYFRDPDGDDLAYQATSSVEGVVSATMAGSVLTLMSGDSGISSVTVTASDPDDVTAQHSFDVTVRNQPPVTVGEVPDQTIYATRESVIDVAEYFRDPDGDDLTYQATSSVDGVVSATIADSLLTLTGRRVGSTVVTVTASDPYGATAQQSFTAEVAVAFRDDFDSDASLANWQIVDADSVYVLDSLLHVDSIADGTIGHARHNLSDTLTGEWTVRASMGLAEEGLCSALMVFTGDTEFSAWSFDISHPEESWGLYVQIRGDSWTNLAEGNDESINYEEGALTTITMSFSDGKISAWADGDLILETDDLTGEMPGGGDPPTEAIAIGVGGYDCAAAGTVMVDWVDIIP